MARNSGRKRKRASNKSPPVSRLQSLLVGVENASVNNNEVWNEVIKKLTNKNEECDPIETNTGCLILSTLFSQATNEGGTGDALLISLDNLIVKHKIVTGLVGNYWNVSNARKINEKDLSKKTSCLIALCDIIRHCQLRKIDSGLQIDAFYCILSSIDEALIAIKHDEQPQSPSLESRLRLLNDFLLQGFTLIELINGISPTALHQALSLEDRRQLFRSSSRKTDNSISAFFSTLEDLIINDSLGNIINSSKKFSLCRGPLIIILLKVILYTDRPSSAAATDLSDKLQVSFLDATRNLSENKWSLWVNRIHLIHCYSLLLESNKKNNSFYSALCSLFDSSDCGELLTLIKDAIVGQLPEATDGTARSDILDTCHLYEQTVEILCDGLEESDQNIHPLNPMDALSLMNKILAKLSCTFRYLNSDKIGLVQSEIDSIWSSLIRSNSDILESCLSMMKSDNASTCTTWKHWIDEWSALLPMVNLDSGAEENETLNHCLIVALSIASKVTDSQGYSDSSARLLSAIEYIVETLRRHPLNDLPINESSRELLDLLFQLITCAAHSQVTLVECGTRLALEILFPSVTGEEFVNAAERRYGLQLLIAAGQFLMDIYSGKKMNHR